MMRSVFSSTLVRAAAAVMLMIGVTAPESAAKPLPGRPIRRGQLNLFASNGLLFEVNKQQCGLQADGQTCVAFAGSPVGGGGFWPKGTPDQYIFNSGLQIAGHVSRTAGFAWAGDTVGAFFMDARGDQFSGSPAPGTGGWYNSLNPADIAAWPNGAVVRNASDSIYNSLLEGSQTISQGDAWARYWEGDPAFSTGRLHPSGLLVDQRALAWNFPSGNEDIIYFVFTFYNISARSSSGVYNNSTIPPAVQAEIASFGDQFQDLNEQKFKVAIPDGGYSLDSIYAAFTMDADVAVFSQNYTTAWLPFNIGGEYSGTFLPEVGWTFPASVFGAPFFAGSGFIGVKYLKSPESSPGVQVGLTMFSQTLNSATGFPDPVGVNQLLRYLSGFHGPTDLPCSFSDLAVARLRRLCFLGQGQGDARFFEASGPFALAPGQAASIVVAYINAAPVAVPGISPGPTTDVKPMTPFTGDSIFNNPGDTIHVRTIDRMAGWVSATDLNANNSIEQDEVTTVPRSLLNKGLVAQDVFDHGFLLPNSPVAPEFYLVPGDGQVTVVWQKSASEAAGDPYFAVAADPGSALYDPNFRQFDVEGYRVYRGRTSSDLSLVAQFDYAGTSFIDYTAALPYGDFCAPELGVTTTCPVTFDSVPPFVTGNEVDISGDLIQIPPGGRVKLATGAVLVLAADTAVTGAADGANPALENTGVPFAFVDRSVRNSFTYFYTVTAFDVNSLKSGPTSLESPRITKRVTPRGSVPNLSTAELVATLSGSDNVPLDPSADFTIDPATGRFGGPPPPTDALIGAFAPLVPQLLPALALEAKVDSLTVRTDADGGCPVSNGLGACYLMYVTFTKNGVPQQFVVNQPWPVWVSFDGITNIETPLGAVPVAADSASSANLGVPPGFAQFNATVNATLREYIRFSSFEGQAARRGVIAGTANAGYSPGGSRWFSGANETVDHPGLGIRVGHVTGADTVWAPINATDIDPNTPGVQSYPNSGELQCFGYAFAGLSREADVQFTWGAAGQIATVYDATHHVDELFKSGYEASYGFVGDFNGNGYIDVRDFNYVDIASQWADGTTNPAGLACAHTDPGPAGRKALLNQPVLLPVSVESAPTAGSGTGFGLYVNGERYIFRLTGGTPPASGTVWTLRTYAGTVRSTTATISTATPAGYTFTPTDRNPIIPGLKVSFNVTARTLATAESDSVLNHVHSVPDPYYVTDALEITANQKVLKFVNLPPQAIIRIYSLSGVLVNVLTHNDPGLGGEEAWNLRNRNNQFVASGVYFYQVETPAGHKKLGRFTIVNFAP
jgi:hypothetical protein